MAPMSRNFKALVEAQWAEQKLLCVGLDTDFERIPEAARTGGVRESIVNFNRAIIDATKDIVGCYKPNSAFYERHGDEGWDALRQTIQYINDEAPAIPVILDAKRADIGNTNEGYVAAAFTHLHADAITVQPYLGEEALRPFLEQTDKGIFMLCRTSNPGSDEYQGLQVTDGASSKPLYQVVAEHTVAACEKYGNCGLVVGATYPEELAIVRRVAPELPILIPGIGAQGGDIEQTVVAGKNARGTGMIISVSRTIIFASKEGDFADAARVQTQTIDAAIRAAL